MSDLRLFHGPNAGYVLELYERYLDDPDSVGEGWRSLFQGFSPSVLAEAAGAAGAAGAGIAAPALDVGRLVGAHELAESIRARGHTAADLNPIAPPSHVDPSLRPEAHGLAEADLAGLPAEAVRGPAARGARSAAEAVQRLRELYSGSIGYEFDHIVESDEREWLREAVESGRYHAPLEQDEKRAVLRRLSQVEGFEKYLHKTFFGQKRFSIEGTDMMVPMLDEIIDEAGAAGAHEVVIGMAHRGRLNVLTHVLGKPYALMLAGFIGAPKPAPEPEAEGGEAGAEPAPRVSGDVKYHMGWRDTREVGDHTLRVSLAPNPSHLEFVNPVVIGMTRAAQDDTDHQGTPTLHPERGVAVLLHGDAAFPGQGVVAETLNFSQIPGYTVGGSIHIIVNNQIGFTTLPEADRSTRYSSDLAKGFEVPIVHVNADDPEACLAVARLAHAYRERFHKDFVIDLVGYRRWGHNEGDEPAFTQPRMYETIREHPTARERWAQRLVEQGVVEQHEADALLQQVLDELAGVQEAMERGEMPDVAQSEPASPEPTSGGGTAVGAERLRELNEALLERPEGFQPNARLDKLLARRRDALENGEIDWGHAEALAFASLLQEGRPIRITGQDAERGTFSHRHLVLHDAETGARHDVLAALPQAEATFEIHNSPLSELAVLGFEFGFTSYDPDVLVLWEAQFGDFANGAQVIIDQFIASSYQKWKQRSGLVMLLPHGYEGQGPEHSSARLERFLQLAAEENLRVANCTTSAQYFHLLRRQSELLDSDPRPLIVMSPKSLLRHRLAASSLEQLADGRFQPVLGDTAADSRAKRVRRLLLCSGKVFVDLYGSELREQAEHVALARVEELYPLPVKELRAELMRYPNLQELVWVQEEPRNMGAWSYMEPRLRELVEGHLPVRYVGRPDRASPAEGYADMHAAEQARIVSEAWAADTTNPNGE